MPLDFFFETEFIFHLLQLPFLDGLPRVSVTRLRPRDQLCLRGLALDGGVGVEGQPEVGQVLLDSLGRVPHLLHCVAETNLASRIKKIIFISNEMTSVFNIKQLSLFFALKYLLMT